jgi:HEAT repeat protein
MSNFLKIDQLIADLCDGDVLRQQQAKRALMTMKDPDVLPAVIRRLDHPEREVRMVLINLLMQFDDVRAIPALIEMLEIDADPGVRAAAAEALGELSGDDACAALEHALLHDEDGIVRAEAATALGVISDVRSTEALVRALGEKDSLVWHAAGEALWQIGEEAMPYVIASLIHADHDLRKAALRAVLWLSIDADEEEPLPLDDMGYVETWGWWN